MTLSPKAQAALDLAVQAYEPSAADFARCHSSLQTAMACGGAAGGATAAGTGFTKLLLVVMAAGGIGIGVPLLVRDSTEAIAPESASVIVPDSTPSIAITSSVAKPAPSVPPSLAPSASPTAVASQPPVKQRLRRRAAKPSGELAKASPSPAKAPPSPAKAPSSTLAQELKRLRAARQALLRGQSAQALRLVRDFEARFPGGTLLPEAIAIRIDALCGLGEKSRASSEASKFVKRWSSSPIAERIVRPCNQGEKP